MTDQPGSARFQALLGSALQACEKGVPGVTLADLEDPLAARLQTCHSIDDITSLLQGQVRSFRGLLEPRPPPGAVFPRLKPGQGEA